jgi:hypothetical protein
MKKLPIYEIKELLRFHTAVVLRVLNDVPANSLSKRVLLRSLKDEAVRIYQLLDEIEPDEEPLN